MGKVFGALLAALLALASCASPAATAVVPAADTEGTPGPYRDLQPLEASPEGGWSTERMEDLGLAFQVPSVYDELACGTMFVTEKGAGEEAYTLVGSAGGTIRIRVFHAWSGDLAEYAFMVTSDPGVRLLTAVEPFTLGGVPAFRHMYEVREPPTAGTIKVALAAFAGRLYVFQYNHMDVPRCDAPPLVEEAIYEHLLSTLEFIPFPPRSDPQPS